MSLLNAAHDRDVGSVHLSLDTEVPVDIVIPVSGLTYVLRTEFK